MSVSVKRMRHVVAKYDIALVALMHVPQNLISVCQAMTLNFKRIENKKESMGKRGEYHGAPL